MAKESSQHKGHRQRMRARVEQYGLEVWNPTKRWNMSFISPTPARTPTALPMSSWTGSETLPGCWMLPRRIC